MRYTLILLTAFFICIAPFAVAGERNITELKIEEVSSETQRGAFFTFSFSAGNLVGQPCDARIDYWLGTIDRRLVEGRDTVFLAAGEKKSITSFLPVPENIGKSTGFYLQMQCNDSNAMASRSIKITDSIPTTPQIMALQIKENKGAGEFDFTYTLRSYRTEPHPIKIEETVETGESVVWKSDQTVSLAGTVEFSRKGPSLPAGDYSLGVKVTGDNETSKATRNFTISPSSSFAAGLSSLGAWPLVFMAAIAVLFFAAVILLLKSNRHLFNKAESDKRGTLSMSFGIPRQQKIVPAAMQASKRERQFTAHNGREGPEPSKNYVCLVEAEASGVLGSNELNQLLDDAGFNPEENNQGLRFASETPLSQTARSAVFIDQFGKANSETEVTIAINNESPKDWCDVMLVAMLPEFLSENVSQIETDSALQATKEGNIIKLIIPRIAAMEAASVSYSIAKWVPQEKLNSIPLPAVVNRKESQPLIVRLKKAGKTRQQEKNELTAAQSSKKGKEPKL